MSDEIKDLGEAIIPEVMEETPVDPEKVIPFGEIPFGEGIPNFESQSFTNKAPERPMPVSDGTHYIIKVENTPIFNATAAYLYWAIIFFRNIPQSEVFLLKAHEGDEGHHPEGSHYYFIGNFKAPDIQGNKDEYAYFSHPFEVWSYVIAPMSNYPYCEVMMNLYGDGTGQGINEEYRKNYLEGQTLFDTSPTNMLYWGNLFEEEKYFMDEVIVEEPTRKFDKFKSKSSKKKQAEANAKKKDNSQKPARYFRQEVHNSGLVLNTKQEAYERYLAFNTSFELLFPVEKEDGTELRLNFISLNTPECRLSALDPVFDPNVHDGCLYYHQINPSTYKLTLFTKALENDTTLALEDTLLNIGNDPDPEMDIHRAIKTKVLGETTSMVSSIIFVSRAIWDGIMDLQVVPTDTVESDSIH